MNIVLLKGLIIAGGAAGIGVPGIYYGYPYISSLISPESETDAQKPSEEKIEKPSINSQPTTPSQVGEGSSEQSQKDGTTTGDTDGSATNPKETASETDNKNTQGNVGKTDTEQSDIGNSAGGGTGTTTTKAPGQPVNQQGNDS